MPEQGHRTRFAIFHNRVENNDCTRPGWYHDDRNGSGTAKHRFMITISP